MVSSEEKRKATVAFRFRVMSESERATQKEFHTCWTKGVRYGVGPCLTGTEKWWIFIKEVNDTAPEAEGLIEGVIGRQVDIANTVELWHRHLSRCPLSESHLIERGAIQPTMTQTEHQITIGPDKRRIGFDFRFWLTACATKRASTLVHCLQIRYWCQVEFIQKCCGKIDAQVAALVKKSKAEFVRVIDAQIEAGSFQRTDIDVGYLNRVQAVDNSGGGITPNCLTCLTAQFLDLFITKTQYVVHRTSENANRIGYVNIEVIERNP